MITLTKSGNAIVFTFDDNDHYLNDGTIAVPVNSLTLVTDESQMATFRKSASNDIFISATYDELGMSKADLESWFKENACGSTGGGGGGVTSGEVQTMIDESISGKADTSDVQNVASDVATVSGDVNTLSGSVNALTGSVNTLSGDVSTLSGAVDSNHNAITALNGDVSTLSGQVETDEKVTATALNALNNGLTGATASIINVSSTLNNHTGDSEIHVNWEDKENWNSKIGWEDVTNEVQKDSNELVEGGGIFNKVAYTTTASTVVTGETTNKRIGTVSRFGSWTNSVDSIQNWCWDEELPEGSCDLEGGELRMSFNNDISELDITIGDYSNTFTVRYDSNEDNLEADNATVEWADATTKREIIITDYPTIVLEELDTAWTDDATVTPVEESNTYVRLKYVYSSEQTIETTHWVVDEIKNKVDKTEFEARLGEDEEVTSAALNELNEALSGKQDTLIAGTNITISGNVISAQGGGSGSSINVVQTTGSSSADVMSQSAVTSSINAVSGAIPTQYVKEARVDNDGGKTRWYVFQKEGQNAFNIYNFSINGRMPLSKQNGTYSSVDNFSLVETSAITSSVTSASTDSQVPSAKAVYDALQEGGGVPESAFTAYTASTDERISEDEEVTAAGLNALNNALSGKQDTLSAGTNITISGNVISAEGGGKAISGGTNISVTTGATADTINCTLPISVSNTNKIIISNHNNSVYNNDSIIVGGSYNTANADHTHVGGRYNSATNDFETAFGNANNSNKANTTYGNSGNTLFSVGNGVNSSIHHNALEIRQNGDVYIPNTDDTTYSNYYQKPMYRLQDLIAALGGLKLVQISQSDYDNLQNKDASTLYIITNNS